ncbi:MAG: sulfite exporter TauE/SafE family protein [Gammaproteobacteria bacterium]|nr:sulfite exporter TauE/SafE family protein [Gammaproteobacteria bacterium]
MSTFFPPEISLLLATFLVLFSFFTSAVSATFGLGGGVAMLVGLLMVVPPAVALPLHGVIQVGSNTSRAVLMRANIMRPVLYWFIPGTLVGVVIASLIFTSLPLEALQLILALFILWSVWAPKPKARRPIADRHYLAVGAFGSFTTMFLGATGPFLAAFLSPDRYGKERTVATHAACMTLQHLVKVIAFGLLAFAYLEWVPLLVLMLLAGVVGSWSGKALLNRMPEEQFKRWFKLMLTVLALRLLYTALT